MLERDDSASIVSVLKSLNAQTKVQQTRTKKRGRACEPQRFHIQNAAGMPTVGLVVPVLVEYCGIVRCMLCCIVGYHLH